jgi:predicted small lipoprotein YifL
MLKTAGLGATLMLLIGIVMLSGCGQKGPLYLPSDNQKEEKK